MFDVATIEREIADGTAVLLDVRTKSERDTDGFARGSVHVDAMRLYAGETPDVPAHMKLYIYCWSGSRASAVKDILTSRGFTNAVVVGGLSDWERAGGVVEKS